MLHVKHTLQSLWHNLPPFELNIIGWLTFITITFTSLSGLVKTSLLADYFIKMFNKLRCCAISAPPHKPPPKCVLWCLKANNDLFYNIVIAVVPVSPLSISWAPLSLYNCSFQQLLAGGDFWHTEGSFYGASCCCFSYFVVIVPQ